MEQVYVGPCGFVRTTHALPAEECPTTVPVGFVSIAFASAISACHKA